MSLGKLKRKMAKINCHLRSVCKAQADNLYYSKLFDREWEVFVVKKNKATGNLGWSTLCCELALSGIENVNKSASAACC